MGFSDVVKSLMKELEVYMIYMVLAIGSFLVFFGSSRRRYNSAFLRFLIMVAFNSTFAIITLIIGQMVSGPVTTQVLFYPRWVYFLLLFHGISDGISAQALEDNDQWNRYVLTLYAGLFWVIGAFVRSNLPVSIFQTIAMVMSSTYKAIDKIQALKKGSRNGVALDTKSVADFMAGDDQTSFLNYVVSVQEKRSYKDPRPKIDIDSEKVITVGKVWRCQGPDSKVKDLGLSFSMYNLLCCHFSGYSFPQSVRDRQLEFVRSVLLHGDVGAGENYRWPFWLIEQELGFVYDCFYTNYAHLFQKYCQVRKVGWYVFTVAALIVWQLTFLIPPTNDHKLKQSTHNDILVTRIIVGVFMCLEFLQFLFLVVSNWGKLFCLCKYVGQPSWRSRKLRALCVKAVCSFPSSQLWGRQLGQYCFLKSFNKSPGWIYKYPFSLFLENPGKDLGHAGSTFVTLSPEVQRSVLAWIKENGRQLTKGRSSLIGNGVRNPELLSACEFKETAKVIMIWHIATSLCEFQHGKTSRPLETIVVSMALSKYCAYLVAFAPRLLPDHYMCTNDLFASAVTGAEWMLKGCKSKEDKCSKLMNFGEIAQSLQTDFVAGAGGRVAKLVMEEAGDDVEKLWKIFADFWTEMVLFVAPADDPWPHAEHLAQGGEFVTHLMALLFHAGVAKRDFIEDDAMV